MAIVQQEQQPGQRRTTDRANDATPYPGDVFIIRDRLQGRAITLIDGALKLLDDSSVTGNWYWACTERDIYLGFYNKASKCYIGHNGEGKVVATATKHQGWEDIVARRHPEGGYELLMTYKGKNGKLILGIDEESQSLIATANEAVKWEFTVVPERV